MCPYLVLWSKTCVGSLSLESAPVKCTHSEKHMAHKGPLCQSMHGTVINLGPCHSVKSGQFWDMCTAKCDRCTRCSVQCVQCAVVKVCTPPCKPPPPPSGTGPKSIETLGAEGAEESFL